MLILAGDIGGTNTRLCLTEVSEHYQSSPLLEAVYPSSPDGLAAIVKQFLDQAPKPDKACFALAGPVLNHKCKVTNLPWPELETQTLQQELQIPQVALINDFVAIAYNLILETNNQLLTLQTGEYSAEAPKVIIGAGTGLGKALAIPQGDSYQVFPTEGGHQNFAPMNALLSELGLYWQRDGLVDLEKIVSGPGIVNIFRFLGDRQFPQENTDYFLSQADPAFAISQGAKQGNLLCQQTMSLFIQSYGAAVGDMAVNLLPFGGIYIAGGIATKNLERMKDGLFMQAFKHKARVNPQLLEKIPVHIVLNTLEGLQGAIKYAIYKM